MKIASHNSLTYLPVKKWYFKPLKFTAQCQSKTLKEQYELGIRLFDIRIIFDKENIARPVHGLIEFDGDVVKLLEELNSYGDKVYCRIINERDDNYDKFREFCLKIEQKFKNIVFFGGVNKKDWRGLYDFRNNGPKFVDKYSSWNNDTKIGTGWHLDDLFPRIYAICLNKYWRRKLGNDETFLMQDFVGVY